MKVVLWLGMPFRAVFALLFVGVFTAVYGPLGLIFMPAETVEEIPKLWRKTFRFIRGEGIDDYVCGF